MPKDIAEVFGKIELTNDKHISTSNPSIFEKIQEQRHKQQKYVFWLAWGSVIAGLVLLIALFVGSFLKCVVFDSYFPHTFIVSFFAYSFGILRIITKSLWDDKDYSNILQTDYMKNKERDSN
jgi:membrane-anchored protein YejM (alkaline phosphatase superfamily)